MKLEIYDLDVCLGHAANGEYHHHSLSPCLTEYLEEDGSAHSRIYGWIVDNYPIYGPYQSANVLAKPCWFARDYSSSSVTGCSSGDRDCQLVNMWDYTEGTVSVSAGPSITGTTTSLSGNDIPSVSGIYLEDYYYNASCTSNGEEYLDAHNGHDHGSYGYHYHFTMDSDGTPIFPYLVGPTYYGCVSSSNCCGDIKSMTCKGLSICESDTGVSVDNMLCTSGKTTVSTTTTSDDDTSSDGLSVNAIVGIVVGIIGGCCILVIGFCMCKPSTSAKIAA
jgi:hypothetical protein